MKGLLSFLRVVSLLSLGTFGIVVIFSYFHYQKYGDASSFGNVVNPFLTKVASIPFLSFLFSLPLAGLIMFIVLFGYAALLGAIAYYWGVFIDKMCIRIKGHEWDGDTCKFCKKKRNNTIIRNIF